MEQNTAKKGSKILPEFSKNEFSLLNSTSIFSARVKVIFWEKIQIKHIYGLLLGGDTTGDC